MSKITCSDCPLCNVVCTFCEDYCSGMADFVDEIKTNMLDSIKQKQRTIIDEDGVMYRVVFLKDIEDIQKEVK